MSLTTVGSSYRNRRSNEVVRELSNKDVLTEIDGRLDLLDLNFERDHSTASDRIALPARLGYGQFTMTALKILIACYSRSRYSRQPFHFTITREELADRANVAPRGVETAIRQLADRRLLEAKKLWKEGTEIRLLDPESGVWLSTLGEGYVWYLKNLPVPERYRLLLSMNDETGKLAETTDGLVALVACVLGVAPRAEPSASGLPTVTNGHVTTVVVVGTLADCGHGGLGVLASSVQPKCYRGFVRRHRQR